MTKTDVIKGILQEHPELRHGDRALWIHIAKIQCEELGLTTLEEFWEAYKHNGIKNEKIWSAAMVRSTSCSLRKAHPELRPPLEDQLKNEEIRKQNAEHHRNITNQGGITSTNPNTL